MYTCVAVLGDNVKEFIRVHCGKQPRIKNVFSGTCPEFFRYLLFYYWKAIIQRIARRDKKDFLSDQCKEIEENNRMGKTRDLFKKIRDTKGTFHAKMGSKKDRNCMDLTEAKDIKS